MGKLDGKLAVVTGASGELGLAIVKEFLSEGAYVAAVCHTREGDLRELGGEKLSIYHMDVCDAESVRETSTRILEEMGEVQILVNNAGISSSALFFSMDDAQWERVLETNLYGPRNVTKQFLLSMVRSRQGSVINMRHFGAAGTEQLLRGKGGAYWNDAGACKGNGSKKCSGKCHSSWIHRISYGRGSSPKTQRTISSKHSNETLWKTGGGSKACRFSCLRRFLLYYRADLCD